LVAAATNIRKEVRRNTSLLQQLLDIDKVLEQAEVHAHDALEKMQHL
jgi:hypothetical protein